mgnify:CR=1 FL=1
METLQITLTLSDKSKIEIKIQARAATRKGTPILRAMSKEDILALIFVKESTLN